MWVWAGQVVNALHFFNRPPVRPLRPCDRAKATAFLVDVLFDIYRVQEPWGHCNRGPPNCPCLCSRCSMPLRMEMLTAMRVMLAASLQLRIAPACSRSRRCSCHTARYRIAVHHHIICLAPVALVFIYSVRYAEHARFDLCPNYIAHVYIRYTLLLLRSTVLLMCRTSSQRCSQLWQRH